MKYFVPFLVITASAYAAYRLIKSGLDEPDENRLMVCYDPDNGYPVLIPEPSPVQSKPR
jgi:hypothetical protein